MGSRPGWLLRQTTYFAGTLTELIELADPVTTPQAAFDALADAHEALTRARDALRAAYVDDRQVDALKRCLACGSALYRWPSVHKCKGPAAAAPVLTGAARAAALEACRRQVRRVRAEGTQGDLFEAP